MAQRYDIKPYFIFNKCFYYCLKKGYFMDLVGKKIGKLYVIEKTKEKEKSNHEYKYRCICDCGKEKLIRGSNLKSNNSKPCGCENIKKVATISKGYRNKNRRLYINHKM